MAASAERCSTLIWRGLGGIASRSVPRRAAGAPGPRAAGYTRRDARARGVVDRGGGARPGARRAGPRPAGADARRPAVAERHGPVDAVEHRRRRWTEDVAGGPDLRRRHHPHRRHHDRDPHGRTRALAAHRPRRSADRVGPLARPPPPPAAQQAAGAGQGEEGEGAAAEESLRRRAQALLAHRRRRTAASREGRLAQAAPSSRGTFGLHDSPNVPLGRQDPGPAPLDAAVRERRGLERPESRTPARQEPGTSTYPVPSARPFAARHARSRRTNASASPRSLGGGVLRHQTYVNRRKASAATKGEPTLPTDVPAAPLIESRTATQS